MRGKSDNVAFLSAWWLELPAIPLWYLCKCFALNIIFESWQLDPKFREFLALL